MTNKCTLVVVHSYNTGCLVGGSVVLGVARAVVVWSMCCNGRYGVLWDGIMGWDCGSGYWAE